MLLVSIMHCVQLDDKCLRQVLSSGHAVQSHAVDHNSNVSSSYSAHGEHKSRVQLISILTDFMQITRLMKFIAEV